MITVAILVNGQPIMSRSARRTEDNVEGAGVHRYRVDDGTEIVHRYDDGAVALAKKLLDTIKV
jgi:hypothetical protein